MAELTKTEVRAVLLGLSLTATETHVTAAVGAMADALTRPAEREDGDALSLAYHRLRLAEEQLKQKHEQYHDLNERAAQLREQFQDQQPTVAAAADLCRYIDGPHSADETDRLRAHERALNRFRSACLVAEPETDTTT